jgi:hypothetical protein
MLTACLLHKLKRTHFSVFVFLTFINISLLSFAAEQKLNDNFFNSLKTPEIEFIPKEHLSTYPFFAFSPYNFVGLRWNPEWNEELLPNSCSKNLIKSATTETAIKKLWQNCEPQIRLETKNQIYETLSMLSYDFDPLHHPLSHEVVFHLPNSVQVRGILFLRSAEPRPLVIVRAGIFSSFNSMVAERFIFSQIFERGNFHLLIIPSTTGRQFIEDNDHFIFGGFEEGLHTLWIARQLKKSNEPLSQFINEIHTVGISMGANGVLAANLLNAIQKQNWINRSVYFCPLMDFNNTLLQLKQKTFKTILTSLWTGMRLEPLRKKYSISMFEFFDYYGLVEHLTKNYKEPLIGWDDELLPIEAKNISSFFAFNDLNKWLSFRNLTNPSLLFYSLTDPVVPPTTNILSLKDQLPENISILPMTKGFHCSVPANYNEAFMATFINSFLNTKGQTALEQKIVWQQKINSEKSELENLKIVNIQLTKDENLFIEIKNDSLFSSWQTKVEIPHSAIDMYFNSQIWNRHLKKSLMNWLEAHTQFAKSQFKNEAIFQILN